MNLYAMDVPVYHLHFFGSTGICHVPLAKSDNSPPNAGMLQAREDSTGREVEDQEPLTNIRLCPLFFASAHRLCLCTCNPNRPIYIRSQVKVGTEFSLVVRKT